MPSLHRQEERSFASHRIHHVQPKKRVSYEYTDASISVFLHLPYSAFQSRLSLAYRVAQCIMT
jgi:hypothetical protein